MRVVFVEVGARVGVRFQVFIAVVLYEAVRYFAVDVGRGLRYVGFDGVILGPLCHCLGVSMYFFFVGRLAWGPLALVSFNYR